MLAGGPDPLTTRRSADVTVAVATRDRPALLERCLKALAAGEVAPGEVVVVDQSRAADTKAVADRLREELALPLVYVRHGGSGLGAAQNAAIARARHPVVAVTDDDCVVAENWLAVIEETVAANEVDAVTGRVLPLAAGDPALRPVSSRVGERRLDFADGAAPWDVGSGNNFAVRRELLLVVGGNDERLGPGSQGRGGVDMDLFYRLLRAGGRIRYEPRSVVYHEQATPEDRMARRVPYGLGMGICFVLWLRAGDARALILLGRWLALRGRRLARGLLSRDWTRAREELLVLGGTALGLWHGSRRRARPVSPLADQSPERAEASEA